MYVNSPRSNTVSRRIKIGKADLARARDGTIRLFTLPLVISPADACIRDKAPRSLPRYFLLSASPCLRAGRSKIKKGLTSATTVKTRRTRVARSYLSVPRGNGSHLSTSPYACLFFGTGGGLSSEVPRAELTRHHHHRLKIAPHFLRFSLFSFFRFFFHLSSRRGVSVSLSSFLSVGLSTVST